MEVYMETTTQLDLSHYTGSQVFYKFGLFGSVMSEGVTHVANTLNCWWLVQDIDLYIRDLARAGKDVRFIVAFLTAKDDDGAVLQLQDGEDKTLKEVHIPYTDFDFDAVSDDFQIWAAPNEHNSYTLYLPQEH